MKHDIGLRWNVLVMLAALAAGIWIQRAASWPLTWRASDGSSVSVARMHALCSPVGEATARLTALPGRCATAAAWWDVSSTLFLITVIAAALAFARCMVLHEQHQGRVSP